MDEATKTRIAEIKNEIAHEYAEEQRCITEVNNLYVEVVKYTKVPVVGVFILMAKKKKINQQINNLKVEIAQHQANIQKLNNELATLT